VSALVWAEAAVMPKRDESVVAVMAAYLVHRVTEHDRLPHEEVVKHAG